MCVDAAPGRPVRSPVMPRQARHDILFEPVPIGPHTLRNRFYQVPHCTGFGIYKPYSQAAHRAVKAEGGWAAVCTEYGPVSPDSDESPYASARIWDDADAELLRPLVDEAHRYGALAGIELVHAGVHAANNESRLPALGPSQITSEYTGVTPHAMDDADIRRVHADWVRAAQRARDVGFDIVYAYGAHTYLPGQFLSDFYNHRSDRYGGSIENRARFWIELLAKLRDAVGSRCAIAARVAVDRGGAAAGIGIDDALRFIRLADDLVDLWDVNIGSITDWSHDSGSSRFFKAGWQLEWTGRVREATQKPIVGVGRLTDPDQMAAIIRSGVWDLIGAARPSIADPYLPAKIDDGRLDEIRECIGCNVCIAKGDERLHLGCTQNATAGEEYRRGWHPERYTQATNADRGALIIGAGPAGLECAIVLAKRGFSRVHLVDAAADIGGALRWVPRLPGLGEWGRLLDWRRIQLAKLRRRVEVVGSTHLTSRDVLAYGADIVICATGSAWARDGLNGATRSAIPGADASLAHVLTPEQVMLDHKRPVGQRVVVYDTDGYYVGPGMAEQLRGEGYDIELITALDRVAPFCDETLEGGLLRRHLHRLGIRHRLDTTLTRITPGGVEGVDAYEQPVAVACDAVVLVTQRVSDDTLWRALRSDPNLNEAGIEAVYAIGDCVAPRLLADVIFDGHRLGREIDQADPATPLRYRAERAALL
jgi:dimethylamine/trimethylamine dehydrogenase